MEKIKISIVNYTNTLPFKWALKHSALMQRIELQEDIPSICAQKLLYRQVDLALIPVAVLSGMDRYFIETDYCIGARGAVDSVKLYSNVPLADIETVTLDYQSRSSITLTKVLMKFFWKKDVLYLDAKPGFESTIEGRNAAVVIGDRTFALNGRFNHEYDLAEEWQKFTGLPFVFAAWVSSEQLPAEFISEFNRVLGKGVANIAAALEADYTNTGLSKEKTLVYLSQRIDYGLDAAKREALARFLGYIKAL